jgi:hypothetical protein
MTINASLATLAIDLATCHDHAQRIVACAGEQSEAGKHLLYVQGLMIRALEVVGEAKQARDHTESLLGNTRTEMSK